MTTLSASASEQRNVVLLGKAGGGKSTMANQILGSATKDGKFEVNKVFTSQTTEIQAKTCVLQTATGKMYSVKVIDTVGLFDTKKGEPGNKEVFKLARTFFKEKAPEGVHLILFVAKQGRWTEEEKKTFQFIRKNLTEEISAISALIFTNCDALGPEKREKIVQEFWEDKERAEIARFMGKGLHTVGFPNLDDMIPALQEIYKEQMITDQEVVRRLIYESSDQYLSTAMLTESVWKKLLTCL